MMEIINTKYFDDIIYIDENHSYWYNDEKFTSVTQYLSRYKQPFDTERWSKHSAEKEGISQQAILERWDSKGKASLEKGSTVHNAAELILKNETLSIDDSLPEIKAAHKFWTNLRDNYNARLLKAEWVIGDKLAKIAGRVDAIIQFERQGKTITSIIDWKTGNIKLKNHFEKMKKPFDDLDDCSHNHYSIQLSLYRLILEKNLGIKLDHGMLINLTERGEARPLIAKDMRAKLIRLLYP
jgi:ATP-dependent exoDNAse (exonuclease V) beta subunit